MNNWTGIGRLTKDVEVRYTGEQMAIGSFTIAIDDGYGEKKRTDFIPVVVFGKRAETCEKYIGKGSLVGVKGKIRVESYKNKDGKTAFSTKIVADDVEFLNSAQKNRENVNESVTEPMEDFQAINEAVPF